MQKKKITTLFLDIGGVLLSNGWGHSFRNLAVEKFHLDSEAFELRHKLLFVVYEEGRITLDEYLDRVVFYEKRDFTKDEFTSFMHALTTPNIETIALMRTLKDAYKLKVVAVSNEARELNAYRIKTFKLTELIDFFVSSCYFHVRKPDATIFKLALDAAQVPSDEIVYIDDVQMFVDVAKELGINAIRHTDCATTSKALAALGLDIKETT
ncbi:MAG: HAD-IA family hydrolase [Chryseolinea sp.]